MAFEHYLRSGDKKLRCGYTTGTCAALAALGASMFLLTGECPKTVSVMTEKGIPVRVPIFGKGKDEDGAWCSVIKDAGDDADITDGMEIKAIVSLLDTKCIEIDGGKGVGRVTKEGLNQPVGNAAINSGPRKMIEKAVQGLFDEFGYEGGASIVISAPEGEEKAKHTFNAMLGIKGGISILGTSGIVEPMSEKALIDTIEVSIRQAAAYSKNLILTPGNYGEKFISEENLTSYGIPIVKCSNFIGESLDIAGFEDFENILLIGHIGKFVKIAGGVMNTHSKYADCRNEIFCAYGAVCGAGSAICKEIMSAATTDACIEILDRENLRAPVIENILQAIQKNLERRSRGKYQIGAMFFSNEYGVLGFTENAKEIINQWNKDFGFSYEVF